LIYINAEPSMSPWSTTATGQTLGCFYFEDKPGRRSRQTADEGCGAAGGGDLRQAAGVVVSPQCLVKAGIVTCLSSFFRKATLRKPRRSQQEWFLYGQASDPLPQDRAGNLYRQIR
jgi:hypothetical protein